MKGLKYVLFSVLISLFMLNVAHASTLTGGIHVYNDTRQDKRSINLFEETANHTNFAKTLYSYSYNIGDYFNEIIGAGNTALFNNYNYGISIMDSITFFTSVYDLDVAHTGSSKTDLTDFSGTYFTQNGEWCVYADHVNEGLCGDENNSRYNSPIFSLATTYSNGEYKDVHYVVVISTTLSGNDFGKLTVKENEVTVEMYPKYVIYFDSQFNYIGYSNLFGLVDNSRHTRENGYGNNFPHFKETILFSDSHPDMTSWYSLGFKLNISSTYDKIYPLYFYLDKTGDSVKVENNAGYSGVSGFFNNLFSDYYDLGSANLKFVYDDVFYTKGGSNKNLFQHWFTDSSITIPSDYLSTMIDSSLYGKYFVPSGTCTKDDYVLFYSNSNNVGVYGLYLNYYKKVGSSLSIQKKVSIYSPESYLNYMYNPFIDLEIEESEFEDYAINIYQNSLRNTYTVYYKSGCYHVETAYQNNPLELPFKSGTITLSGSQVDRNFNYDNINGSFYTPGSTSPSHGTNSDEVNNSGSIVDDYDEGNLNGIFGNISNFVGNIWDSINTLVGICTNFLTGLPPEVSGTLFAVFNIGIIIILIKVFL